MGAPIQVALVINGTSSIHMTQEQRDIAEQIARLRRLMVDFNYPTLLLVVEVAESLMREMRIAAATRHAERASRARSSITRDVALGFGRWPRSQPHGVHPVDGRLPWLSPGGTA